jgi:hypothetical protein
LNSLSRNYKNSRAQPLLKNGTNDGLSKMTEAQAYFDGLVAQGYTAEQAVGFTRQHFPEFGAAQTPVAVAPVAVAPVAVAAAPGMVMAQPGLVVVQQNKPDTLIAYLLWFFLGFFGIHHIYMGRGVGIFVVAFITFQGLGFWWLADLFLIPGSCSKIRGL